VISKTVLIATAGVRVSVKLAQRWLRQLTILDLLSLFVCQIYACPLKPAWLGPAPSPSFSALFPASRPRVRTSDSTIRFMAESWSATRETAVKFSGIDGPAVMRAVPALVKSARSPPVVARRNMVEEKTGLRSMSPDSTSARLS
jgi:hypothetical protein